jgi:hypothetical protein
MSKQVGVVSSVAANGNASLWEPLKAAGVGRAHYHAKEDCEVSFRKGDKLQVLAQTHDWLRVVVERSKERGLCPISYVDVAVSEESDRASQRNLLDELDNMFDDIMSASDAEREEDEEVMKVRRKERKNDFHIRLR